MKFLFLIAFRPEIAVFCGSQMEVLPKIIGKIGVALKSGLIGDLADTPVCSAQQDFSGVQAGLEQILFWRDAGLIFEFFGEIRGVQTGARCQILYGDRKVIIGFDVVDRLIHHVLGAGFRCMLQGEQITENCMNVTGDYLFIQRILADKTINDVRHCPVGAVSMGRREGMAVLGQP